MNKFGISLWNWVKVFDDSAAQYIDRAAALGFTAVEIPLDSTALDTAALAARLRANSLESTVCAAMTKGRDVSSDDESERAAARAYLLRAVDVAAALGAKLVGGPIYAGGGKAHLLDADAQRRERERAVKTLRDTARHAAECGVALAIEPLHRYRTSVVNTAAQAVELCREIGEPNVGVLFDTYHANIEEQNITGALDAVIKSGMLKHFHACSNSRGAPGDGHLPWEEICALLRGRYAGHLTMECFRAGGFDSTWREQGGADELAARGLAFLQRNFE